MAIAILRITNDEFNERGDKVNEILQEEGGEVLEILDGGDENTRDIKLELNRRGFTRLKSSGFRIRQSLRDQSSIKTSLEDVGIPEHSEELTLEEVATMTGEDIFKANDAVTDFNNLEGSKGI